VTKHSHHISDLISVACHYDENTLLTKNGELIQFIKVKGFAKRFAKLSNTNLRDVIRNIIKNLLTKNLMFYLYVKRDYMNIASTTGDFHSEFAQMQHEMWINENNFKSCLMNTLYIGIVHCGARDAFASRHFFKQFFFRTMKRSFEHNIEIGLKEISETSGKILQELEQYGVNLLSIVQKDDKLISEPLSFIYYLTHYHDKDVEISRVNCSKVLAFNLKIHHWYNHISFNTNDGKSLDFDGNISVSSEDIQSHFTAVFSLKSPYSLMLSTTDQILSLDQKMLIYETIRITNKATYLDLLKKQKIIYHTSKMQGALHEVEKQIKALEITPCIKSQISIITIADTEDTLNVQLHKMKELLFDIGISTVREDYNMMGTIYGAIPCNTYFLRRENYNIIENSAIFSSIRQKCLGGHRGSIWGMPITIFKTLTGLPYFFNFHNKDDIGHTIIVGQKINQQYLLRNFLIGESFAFDLKLVHFDNDSVDDETMKIYGATIQSNFSLNLLRIINNDPQILYKIFLYVLLSDIVLSDEIEKQIMEIIHAIIEIILQGTADNEEASNIIEKIHKVIDADHITINSDIKSYFNEFFSLNCFFKCFYLDTKVDSKITSLSIGKALQELTFEEDNIKEKIKSLLTFLYLKDINNELNSTNVEHILLSVGHSVLSFGNIFNDEFITMFKELAKKHVVVIINCQNRKDLYHSPAIASIIQAVIPTRFFLSDKFVDNEFRNIFQLSNTDLNKIKTYSPAELNFLLRQDEDMMVSSFRILKEDSKVIN
jgi:type IV secretion system protein VirB4